MKFFVIVQEEHHIAFEAESEEDVRHKFNMLGPLQDQGGDVLETFDKIIKIEVY